MLNVKLLSDLIVKMDDKIRSFKFFIKQEGK